MADECFERLWDDVVDDIHEVYQSDKKFQRTKVFPDRTKALSWIQNSYIRYVGIVNKLGECYSQIIQPQERSIIKKMLDASVGRFLELKHEMVDLERTDFSYMDNILMQLKKSILDTEIMIPEYYRTDRIEKMKMVDTAITKALEKLNKAEKEPVAVVEVVENVVEEKTGGDVTATPGEEEVEPEFRKSRAPSKPPTDDMIATRPRFIVVEVSEEEKAILAAVKLLQRHERARVSRLRVQLVLERKRIMDDIAWLRHKEIPESVKLKVAGIIGRYWRRYKLKRHITFRSVSRNITMGLLEPSWRPGNELEVMIDKLGVNRRQAQKQAWQAMEDAAVTARIRMEKNSDKICDDIADELRYYIEQWYRTMEKAELPRLPEWPDATPIIPPPTILGVPKDAPEGMAENMIHSVVNTLSGRVLEPIGGSALIVAGHWIPVEIYQIIADQIEKSKGAKKTEKKKMSKKELKAKAKKEKELEAKRLADLKKEGFVPTKSKVTETLDVQMQDYEIDWKDRKISRSHNQNMVDTDVAKNLHMELRQVVDEAMRVELERLQLALDIDMGVKSKPKKEPKKKKGRRGKKDPTGKKTEEEIIEEMASKGLMAKSNKMFFRELPGSNSLTNYEARTKFNIDPPPQWGDFKQVVKEYCVLHMGSKFTHETAPLVRSVLICGPSYLTQQYVDVICTESGSVRFVLDPLASPLNTFKKAMFNHLFTKMPKLLQPSIILIPGAEKMFYKSVPKEEKEFNPKALGKIIPKLVKSIKGPDRILILGTSDQPWAATAGPLSKAFDKVICFPDIDEQTLNRFWSERLLKFHGVNRYFNTSILTKMTHGYDLNVLQAKLDEVMTPKRIISLKFKPLEEGEICLDLPPLDEKKPVMNSWDWCQKSIKMYSARKAQLALEAEKLAKENKGKKAAPEAKKGKKKDLFLEKEEQIDVLVSRTVGRSVKTCSPWMPTRKKDEYRKQYTLLKNIGMPGQKTKPDLYRDKKSEDEFPIKKPII